MTQRLTILICLQPVTDAQPVDGLTDAKLAPGPAEALCTEQAVSANLAFQMRAFLG
ncbi:hypothetical protein I1E95_02810 [Synechococcus sp. CBW1107]|uniref:hypothetical protein n=2 Tax=unclassified Synechococcus TaxID=2626047 RepID=UPI0018CC9F81|nr:hypothetical protein [Synechococcus sp. CBW1107]QPN57110.1 hypothetical protein I1E95_02810 [Synechococcus sp. CBW1107]